MKHKIKIYFEKGLGRWYVECSAECHAKGTWMTGPDGYFGRLTWDGALAQGIAHQQERLVPLQRHCANGDH